MLQYLCFSLHSCGERQAVALRRRSPRQQPAEQVVAADGMQVVMQPQVKQVASRLAAARHVLCHHTCRQGRLGSRKSMIRFQDSMQRHWHPPNIRIQSGRSPSWCSIVVVLRTKR